MAEQDVKRVSTLELFFDLVFVFAITQLSHSLLEHLSLAGAAQTLFLTLAVWWTWTSMTWWTNIADFDPGAINAELILAMLPCMLMAIAIPEAFGDRAALFVAGYVGVRASLGIFALVARRKGHSTALRPGVLLWASVSAVFWVAGAFVDGNARVVLWCVALAIDVAGPILHYRTPWFAAYELADSEISVDHLVERFQLFIIIVLGESIVLTGATAAGLDLTLGRLASIAVAVLITAMLWRLYFGREDGRTQQILATAEEAHHNLARDAFTYLHLPIVAGLIAVAVANELVIAHPDTALHGGELIVLAIGPVLFLLGTVAAVWRAMRVVPPRRVFAAAAIIAVALLGTVLPALATWAGVLAVLTVVAVTEAGQFIPEQAAG